MMKREILNVHVYVSLLPNEVLCRNFVENLLTGQVFDFHHYTTCFQLFN